MHITMVGCVLWAAKSIPNIQAEIWNFVNYWAFRNPSHITGHWHHSSASD
jgi:hypothetical protein